MPDTNVTNYLSAMALCARMLRAGLIDRKEYAVFEEKMRSQYGLDTHSIYRDCHLLSAPTRGNITQTRR